MKKSKLRRPTWEELQMVRAWECETRGCTWEIISETGNGPVAITCSNCGDTRQVINGD